MSMDLNFWKYKEGAAHDDSRVYELACCDGGHMDVLESLPIDEILHWQTALNLLPSFPSPAARWRFPCLREFHQSASGNPHH